jgi:Fur family ferric uptake transcriptional regulator
MSSELYDVVALHETLMQYLAKKGLRITMERSTILEHICRIHGHFDVEMLHKQLEEDRFHVSRACIYNTFELFMNAGLIVRHQFSTQLVQYELKTAATMHHHLVCNYCGTVREVTNDRLVRQITTQRIPKFTCEYYSLTIYGICSKCKFRLANETKTENKK